LWEGALMSVETSSVPLSDISRLLVQADHSPDSAERAAALQQLNDIRRTLEGNLRDVEAGLQAGINRTVEAVALRSALTVLSRELTLLEGAELLRTPYRKLTDSPPARR
jgi:hypothetical protein